MARRRNTRWTSIYWLIDMRPEILLKWPVGLPFYCGKTVLSLQERLWIHKSDSTRLPNRPSAVRFRECGDHVRIQSMMIVAPDGDWSSIEKRWIWILRSHFPGCVNVTSGGQGMPGHIHTAASRAKMSASKKGTPVSAETRAKLSAANKGKVLSAETRAKMSAYRTGRPLSMETRMKVSASRKGIIFSTSHRANMSAALRGRKLSPEHAAKSRRDYRQSKKSNHPGEVCSNE